MKSSSSKFLTALKEAMKCDEKIISSDKFIHKDRSLNHKVKVNLERFKIKLQKILLRDNLRKSEVAISMKILHYILKARISVIKIIVSIIVIII